jgi:anti-anti-sigma factor
VCAEVAVSSTIEGGASRHEPSTRLGIDSIGSEGQRTLLLSGEVDLVTASQLEDAVLQACTEGANALALDLGALTFIDSRGLRAILETQKLCAEHKAEFVLTPGPRQIQRLFEVTGLLKALPFRGSADEAAEA